MKVGFIGLGIMGKPMAKNLIKAGHELFVFDHHEENMLELQKLGATIIRSNKEIASKVDVVVTMLPNSPHVYEVVCEKGGILEGANKGLIIVDTSSISPKVSKEIYAKCTEKGVYYLDSPVSGGDIGAIKGTLSLMVGGDKVAYDKVKNDILLKVGSSAVYCGASGSGNTTKLANNIIVAGTLASLSEAFTLATKDGVDPSVVLSAISGGLAGSKAMDLKVPQMIEGNFNPGFKIDLHIKDLNNAKDLADYISCPLPITDIVIDMFKDVSNDGGGNLDHSAICKHYAKICNCEIDKYNK